VLKCVVVLVRLSRRLRGGEVVVNLIRDHDIAEAHVWMEAAGEADQRHCSRAATIQEARRVATRWPGSHVSDERG
jgi:hypothetical protein